MVDVHFFTVKYRNLWLLSLRLALSFSHVCMIVLNWVAYRPRFVRMTQHWVGYSLCAEFGWNLLRFGSKHYSNTWFYMSVCLCFATCVTLVSGLFIFVVCPCRLKTGWQSERKTLWGRETCKASSIRGINTDKQAKDQTSGRQKYHTHRHWELKSVCGRDGMNQGRMFERKSYSQ